MKFEQYLKEEEYKKIDVTKSISFDELIKIAPQYDDAIKSALNGKSPKMIRGIRQYTGKTPYCIIDPSTIGERRSAHTKNYYTLIMNHAPNWTNYPKRAIVASSDIYKSEGYTGNSDKNLFCVFPINGSDIAQTKVDDIWSAFPDLYSTLDGFNDDIDDCFNHFGIERSDKDYPTFVKACKEFDEKFEIDKKRSIFDETTTYEYFDDVLSIGNSDLFGKYYNGDFMKMLQMIIDPKEGNISKVKAGGKLHKDVEIWTDAKCLLINYYDIIDKSDEIRRLARSFGINI